MLIVAKGMNRFHARRAVYHHKGAHVVAYFCFVVQTFITII